MDLDEKLLQESSEELVAEDSTVNDEENVNTSGIDMLQEHEYNNDDGSIDLAPELNVDENTILLPVSGENGLNADDPAMSFNAADFLEEEEVMDPMDTNIDEEEAIAIRKMTSQVPKKRRNIIDVKYELEDEEPLQSRPKRRGRKPGSKVINGQVYYPTDEHGTTFAKNPPRSSSKATKTGASPSPKLSREPEPQALDENQCRICMSATGLISLFKKEQIKTYADKLMAICPTVTIERKDFLPQFICEVCVNSLNAAFDLKSQCEQTDAELRETLERVVNVKKVKRPASTTYAVPESEHEEYHDHSHDQDFKPSDASPPSADDSDSDYNKPLAKRRTRRRTRRVSNVTSVKSTRKTASTSPPKKKYKSEADLLNVSKSSEQDQGQGAGDFSSGSEEDYSPPKKRRSKSLKSNDGDTLTCRVCNETLPSREELREHKKTQHSQFECNLCGRKFRVQSSLKLHMDKHTQSGELMCDKCDKHFPNKTERRRHMVDVHHEAPAQYVCEKCKRAFTTEVRLQKHNETRCPGFDTSQTKKRMDIESLAMGKDLFKCVAPLTTTYWSDSFSD